jgi:class 3 adenylate cyclase/DNA-binding MarR family transcriptional regulator
MKNLPGKNAATATERQLAAILHTDAVDYSRLMSVDEAGVMRLLSTHRGAIDRAIGQYRGRIANTAGDSVLAAFPSAVDALQCALLFQEHIHLGNSGAPADRRIDFRVGLHVAEVMVRKADMFGDGVNIVARIQSIAVPGCIALSAAVHEYVRRVLPLDFEDLGQQQLRNIPDRVHVYLVRPGRTLMKTFVPSVHRASEAHLARRFHHICVAAISEVIEPYGLVHPMDLAALVSISDAPGSSIDQISQRTGIELRLLRRMLARLSESSLVITRADKGQYLSAKGEHTVRALIPIVRDIQGRILAPLSEAERAMLRDLMTRVVTANT